MISKQPFNLEDRLIDFACLCLGVCDLLPLTKAGSNLEFQLSKSATAAALVCGKAQAAGSRPDFIHKTKIVLKGIRETRVNLRIIKQKPIAVDTKIDTALKEVNELMAIFMKSIETAKANDTIRSKK